MKEYKKPIINEVKIDLSDILLVSMIKDTLDYNDEGAFDEIW